MQPRASSIFNGHVLQCFSCCRARIFARLRYPNPGSLRRKRNVPRVVGSTEASILEVRYFSDI